MGAKETDLMEWNKRLQKEGLIWGTDVLEDSFEQYQNGADFKELVNELKELKKYENMLGEEKGLQVPMDTLKASFEAYKQGTGIDEIAEQIIEGKYGEPLTADELADREYWAENYFDASLAEGKVFTIYDKETGEKQFERPLIEITNEDAFDLEENLRKSSGWRRFEITDKKGNVLITGEDSAFSNSTFNKREFKDIKDVLEYQEKTGVTGYKFEDIESAKKNKGNMIRQEIKSHGFQPTLRLVQNISQLNRMTEKSNSLKDISKMYKEKSLQESNPEAQKLVDKIGNELKGQELAKVVFSR